MFLISFLQTKFLDLFSASGHFFLLKEHYKWKLLFALPLLVIEAWVCVLVTQSCLTFFDPMDYSSPGSSVRGILQARILPLSPFSPPDRDRRGDSPAWSGRNRSRMKVVGRAVWRAAEWEWAINLRVPPGVLLNGLQPPRVQVKKRQMGKEPASQNKRRGVWRRS